MTIEEMIFKRKWPDEDFEPNDFNDWAKENETEAYKILLEIAKELLEKVKKT